MKFEDWFTDIYTKHLRERKIEDKLQLAFNEGRIEGAKLFGKTQTDEIGQVNTLVMPTTLKEEISSVLSDCKTKLQLYRENINGEYLGGREYTQLIEAIDNIFEKL